MDIQPAGTNTHACRGIILAVYLAAAMPLSGCGGGGGNNSKSSKASAPTQTVQNGLDIINTPPVARDDNIQINQDVVAGRLKLSASDRDGDALSYKIVSNGTLGTAVITDASKGTYQYIPDPGQFGIDSFSFSASDATSTSNISTVSVSINGTPIATGSCNTVKQANQRPGLVSTLKATDPETPAMLMYSLLNPDGSDAGLTLMTAKGGMVEITDPTSGTYTYKPASGPGDKRGRDTFRYQVTDPEDALAIATETVIISQAIMPLGDSITDGVDSTGGGVPKAERVGYRQSLHNQLVKSSYMIDFVGSRQSGSVANPRLTDGDHEGHGGWTAHEIAWGRVMNGSDGVFSWLEQNPADFILLHIGTNDLIQTAADVMDILDEIDRWENSANGNPVTVLLARIIDFAPSISEIEVFNNKVERKANKRTNDDIVLVDQQTGAGINYTIGVDMSDIVHPSASGYDKMADVWFDSLEPMLDKCP